MHSELDIRRLAQWIFAKKKKKKIFRKRAKRISKEYIQEKSNAYQRALSRIEHFNAHYQFIYGKVTIRNQKSRWGSCSKKGNLNFNYRIVYLPERLVDSIIVHELCHLKEFNHSKAFWSLVAEQIPNYRERAKELHSIRFSKSAQLHSLQ